MPASHSESVARAWVLAQPVVDAFISSAVHNYADAQDILQDVAVAVLDAHAPSPLEGSFNAWAIGVARHKIADFFRCRKRREVPIDEELLQIIASAFSAQPDTWSAEGEALELCLGRVTGDAKHLLDLRYRDGHSPQEIARTTGRTPEAIRSSLLRVRRSLRECIERRLGSARVLSTPGAD